MKSKKGHASREPQAKHYTRPELRKREKLGRVTEGVPVVVTGKEVGGKGGCFRRD